MLMLAIGSMLLAAHAGYLGYWESRGYSNTGERSQLFLS